MPEKIKTTKNKNYTTWITENILSCFKFAEPLIVKVKIKQMLRLIVPCDLRIKR